MLYKQKRKNEKIIIIVALITLLVVASAGLIFYVQNNLSQNNELVNDPLNSRPGQEKLNDVNLDEPTSGQIDNGNRVKDQTVNSPDKTTSTLSVKITSTNQYLDEDILRVRSLINRLLDAGTCTLTLTQGEKTVTKTTDIQSQASNSTCKGFDVATTELSVGTWNISLNVVSGAETGAAMSSVDIK